MPDPRLESLARVIVGHCARIDPGDLVTIVGESNAPGLAAVEALYAAVLAAGAHPSYFAKNESLQEIILRSGSDEQIRHVCPFEQHRLERCDALIVLIAPNNTHHQEAIDPARIALHRAARRDLLTMSLNRLTGEAGTRRVKYVLAEIPTHAGAQDARMSLSQWEDWVYRAGMLHLPDPIAAWRSLHEQQEKVAEHLRGKETLRFRAPARDDRGETDLAVDITGSAWLNHAGWTNFPDGEVEGGPRSADGVVCFNTPNIFRGVEVDGVRLVFRDGRVVDAAARRNENYLLRMLDQDDGARRIGEIALGTNYAIDRATGNSFFDEKIGGSFHLALGAGYPATGNTNRSALHWDFVCDLRRGGAVEADGQIIQRDGRFLLPGWPGG